MENENKVSSQAQGHSIQLDPQSQPFEIALGADQLQWINIKLPHGYKLMEPSLVAKLTATRVRSKTECNPQCASRVKSNGLAYESQVQRNQSHEDNESIFSSARKHPLTEKVKKNLKNDSPYQHKQRKKASHSFKKQCLEENEVKEKVFTTEKRAIQSSNFDSQTKQCLALLLKLKLAECSWPFLQPVNPIKLKVPTYFSVVKHPMDLSTIEKKLKNANYAHMSQFHHDIQLIIDNSFLFNQANKTFEKLTMEFQNYYKLLLKEPQGSSLSESDIIKEANNYNGQAQRGKAQQESVICMSQVSSRSQKQRRKMDVEYFDIYPSSCSDFVDQLEGIWKINELKKELNEYTAEYKRKIFRAVFPEKPIQQFRGFDKINKQEFLLIRQYLNARSLESQENIKKLLKEKQKK